VDIVKEKLQDVFREVFDDDEIIISDEMTANDIDEWDSLTHIQLIVACEKEFGCKFKTTEIIDLKNVGEFIALLKRKI
jgi:acyl carrier protein